MPNINDLLKAVAPDTLQTMRVIIMEADSLKLDRTLAITIALYESKLNPNAIGDSNTSFGLYQLHEGGELGALKPEEAFNPIINARIALKYVSMVAHQNPKMSPGDIAANAQRPANRALYAFMINTLYPLVKHVLIKLGLVDA